MVTTRSEPIRWQWSSFTELAPAELYAALQLRQRVFVVEQACPYLDADGADPRAMHLLGWEGARLVAYTRVFGAGVKYAEASLGRVVTDPERRGAGFGRRLVEEALRRADDMTAGGPIRIAAQLYLQAFYESFGFVATSGVYEEDGIAHVDMWRRGCTDLSAPTIASAAASPVPKDRSA